LAYWDDAVATSFRVGALGAGVRGRIGAREEDHFVHVDAEGGDDVAEAVSDCQANVLVVLHQAFDLDGLPRRGPPSVVRVSSKWSTYNGPPRSALIHGLLFGVPSLDQLRDGFAPWGALVREPSDAALAWISPAQVRSDATGGETRGWK
jgi:hypothetical protein